MMNLLKQIFGIALVAVFTLCSCGKDDDQITLPTDLPTSRAIFVLNEGNFQAGNASLSVFDPETGKVNNKVFQAVNDRILGDVLQSMAVFQGKGFLVINNSGRIEIIDLETVKSIQTISGLGSPRYLLPLTSEKAYVSDLFGGMVSVLNLQSGKVDSEIPVSSWTEEMISAGGKVFVAAPLSSEVFAIDPETDAVAGSISVTYGPQYLEIDQHGKLWVLSNGKEADNIKPTLTRINPETMAVEWSESFADFEIPSELGINAEGTQLYYLKKDVYRMNIDDTALPIDPHIEADGKLFYGLGIDPVDETVYVSDAIDYVQRGRCYRYKANGAAIDEFETGIIPGDFVFGT